MKKGLVYPKDILLENFSITASELYSGVPDCLEGLRRVFDSDYFESNREEIIKNFIHSTSSGQIKSKIWLVEALKATEIPFFGTIFLCAGWYGFLAFFLLMEKKLSIDRIFLFEKDPLSVKVSEDINRCFVKENWRFKATLKNILDIDYATETFSTIKASGKSQTLTVSPDVVINTSCEHMEDFDSWWSKIPPGKLVILQSNNYQEPEDHVNCVSSLEEFKEQTQISHFFYEGTLDLEIYKRFMLIGYK